MEPAFDQHFAALERRARTTTALLLALSAFGCSYGLLLVTHRLVSIGMSFYPWLCAAAFYLTGELLGLFWFRVIAAQIVALHAKARAAAELRQGAAATGQAGGNGVQLDTRTNVQELEVVQA